MQSWQIFPIILLVGIGVYVLFMRGKRGAGAKQMYANGMAAISAAVAAQRRAGESDPACVMAVTRTTFKAKIFFLALTNHRLFVAESGGPARAFERSNLSLSVARKTWADVGNMQTTYSDGWEARATLPGGENHVWRIYDSSDPQSADAQHIAAFLRDAPSSRTGGAGELAASRARPQ
jgi:hypothetical protein